MLMESVKKICLLCLILLGVFFIFDCNTVKAAEDNNPKSYVDLNADFSNDEVLVVLQHDVSKQVGLYDLDDFPEIDCESIEDLSYSYDEECEMNSNFRRILKLNLRNCNKGKLLEIIDLLDDRDDIYFVEPNYISEKDSEVINVPDDYNPSRQYAIDMIDLPETWNFVTGTNKVMVGILDTGIDATHPDLSSNINYELSKCFVDDSSPLEDSSGHGTNVAGVIGAIGNNGYANLDNDMVGVNWNVDLVSLKFKPNHLNYFSDLIEAISYADATNIKILNCSSGNYLPYYLNISLEQAISNYNGLFICSAGNKAINTDNEVHYPSNFNLENLISVGAVNQCDNIWFSGVDDTSYMVDDLLMVKLESTSNINYSFTINGYYPMTIKLYDNNLNGIVVNETLSNNNTTSVFTTHLPVGVYYLKVAYANNNIGLINVDIEGIHSHYYSYTYYDNTYHTVTCSCGDNYLEPHSFNLPFTILPSNLLIQPNAIPIQKTCYLCGTTIF